MTIKFILATILLPGIVFASEPEPSTSVTQLSLDQKIDLLRESQLNLANQVKALEARLLAVEKQQATSQEALVTAKQTASDLKTLTKHTQEAVNLIGDMLGEIRAEVIKLTDKPKSIPEN